MVSNIDNWRFSAITTSVKLIVLTEIEMAVRSTQSGSTRGPESLVSNVQMGGLMSNRFQMPLMATFCRIDKIYTENNDQEEATLGHINVNGPYNDYTSNTLSCQSWPIEQVLEKSLAHQCFTDVNSRFIFWMQTKDFIFQRFVVVVVVVLKFFLYLLQNSVFHESNNWALSPQLHPNVSLLLLLTRLTFCDSHEIYKTSRWEQFSSTPFF